MGPIVEAGVAQRVAGSMPPPDGVDAIRAAVLHISHSWGGGVARWIADFAGADRDRRQLLLRLWPRRDALGAAIELVDLAQGGQAIATWALDEAIGATALCHEPYRQILQLVIHDLGVEEIIVSSLVGHALDVLATGLPTTVVMHDLYPFCPAMFGWFGKECRTCDRGDLARCRRENPYNVLWSRCVPDEWIEFRTAYAQHLSAPHVRLVAPSRAVAERYAILFPVLREIGWKLVPHGVDAEVLTADVGEIAAPVPSERLRIVVPGRLSPQKGLDLLWSIIDSLTEFADLLLLGAGDFGAGFAESAGVEVVAEYAHDELAGRIAAFQPDCALLLSVLPESFSYTLSEMWALGIPPVATNLGAFAERIVEGETGFLVEANAGAVLARLHALARERTLVDAVAERLRAAPLRTVDDMVADYRAGWPMRETNNGDGMAAAAICASLHRARRHVHWLETVRLTALQDELAARRAETQTHQDEADIQRREVLRREAEIASLRLELDTEKEKREAILASRSWRLVQPLHRLAAAVKRDTPDSLHDSAPDAVPSQAISRDEAESVTQTADSLHLVLALGDPVAARRARMLISMADGELSLSARDADVGDCARSDVICVVSGAQPQIAFAATESAARLMESRQIDTRRVQFPLAGDWAGTLPPRVVSRARLRERLVVPDATRLVIGIGAQNDESGLIDFAATAAALTARRNGYAFVWLGEMNSAWLHRHDRAFGAALAMRALFLLDDADFESCLLAADVYIGCRKHGVYDSGVAEALAAGLAVVVEDETNVSEAIRARSEWMKMLAVGSAGQDLVDLVLASESITADEDLAADVRRNLGSEAVQTAMEAELKAALRCWREARFERPE